MSESILPWISAYFIASGEEYGADLAAIPLVTTKKKKVQLVEFLTYGHDEVVWARVSDKKHMVPIRFNRDAVDEYTQFSRSHITEDKNAIISISNFKPFFARIPLGKGRMSEGSFLALECNSVALVGGRGEPRFGRPEALEMNPDLKEWSEGLKQPGGAGNCLKNRKQVARQDVPTVSVKKPPPPKKVGIPTNQAKAVTASTKPRNFQGIWSISRKSIFRRPPEDVAAILASMKVDVDEESDARPDTSALEYTLMNGNEESDGNRSDQPPHKRRRISALPSPAVSESSSRTRSATPFSEAEWPPSDQHRDDTPPSSTENSSSHPRHPTPGQRAVEKALPPSQPVLPSPDVTVVHETMLIASSSPPTHGGREASRKVPRPPEPFKSDRLLAEPVILAPDSDLSLSQSQSQPQAGVLSGHAPHTETDDAGLDSDDAQTHVDLFGRRHTPIRGFSVPREVEHDARGWAAPSFQVARKSTNRRRTMRSLKEHFRVKLDRILFDDELGVVSWEMLHGILVATDECRRV